MTDDRDSETSFDETETVRGVSPSDKVNNNTTPPSIKLLRGLDCTTNSAALNFSISRLLGASGGGGNGNPAGLPRRRYHRHHDPKSPKSADEDGEGEGERRKMTELGNYGKEGGRKNKPHSNGTHGKGRLSNGSSGHQSDSDIDVHTHISSDSDIDGDGEEEEGEEDEDDGRSSGKTDYHESEQLHKEIERDPHHPLYHHLHHHPEANREGSGGGTLLESMNGNPGGAGPHLNPFPVFGYSSIFLPNFPCPLTSPANHVIRVPAHRPMSNFQMFGQSAAGLPSHPNLSMNELNASPLFSNFDPRSSLLLKDRLSGK